MPMTAWTSSRTAVCELDWFSAHAVDSPKKFPGRLFVHGTVSATGTPDLAETLWRLHRPTVFWQNSYRSLSCAYLLLLRELQLPCSAIVLLPEASRCFFICSVTLHSVFGLVIFSWPHALLHKLFFMKSKTICLLDIYGFGFVTFPALFFFFDTSFNVCRCFSSHLCVSFFEV